VLQEESKMNIGFITDSWYWTWNWDSRENVEPKLKSKDMRSLLWKNKYDDFTGNISLIDILLEKVGHVAVPRYCNPGASLVELADYIVNCKPSEYMHINVIICPEVLRSDKLIDFLISNRDLTFHEITELYDQQVIEQLTRIGQHATETGQHFIIVGGQGTVSKKLLRTIPVDYRLNLHLISECIVSDTLGISPPLGRFKLADIFAPRYKAKFGHLSKQTLDYLYNNTNQWITATNCQSFPDAHHMNASVVMFFLDKILHYIENSLPDSEKTK
jgi:hypothetical protein